MNREKREEYLKKEFKLTDIDNTINKEVEFKNVYYKTSYLNLGYTIEYNNGKYSIFTTYPIVFDEKIINSKVLFAVLEYEYEDKLTIKKILDTFDELDKTHLQFIKFYVEEMGPPG